MARRPERRPPDPPARPRPARPRLVSPQRRRDDRRAILILAASLLAVVAAGVLGYMSRAPALDAATGCARGRLIPPAHTVVLVDQTDALSARQIDYAKALILLEYQRLRPGGRITVRPIDADPDSTAREFSRCRVRRGDEVSGVTSNPDMVEASFRRIVGDALNAYLDGLAATPTAAASPILETIDTVVEARDFGANVPDRRLVILSDMAQRSARLDQYAAPGDSTLTGPPTERPTDGLQGVTVRVHYLRRAPLARLQTPAHRRFWIDRLTAAGASVQLGWGLQLVDGDGAEAGR